MDVTPKLLRQVYLDNMRANQIGGQADGISPEVAADLGFQSAEEVEVIIDSLNTPDRSVAQKVGGAVCADCFETIPCAHAGVSPQGKGYTKGY